MPKSYILLGADIGDKKTTFARVEERITETVGCVLRKSSLYESAPWGFESDTIFLNQVLEVSTSLSPSQLLDRIQTIEGEFGRVRTNSGYESRLIDIDILFYNDLAIDTPRLTIPHTCIADRMFTLEPLYELIPDFVHPSLHKSIFDLKSACTDSGLVVRVN